MEPTAPQDPTDETPAEVITEIVDGVGILTLDAPKRRNAFTLDMCRQTAAALDTLETDPAVGAIVVTGNGSAFCAGADLSHLGTSQRQGLLDIYEGFLRVARSPLPTIAAVNGPAVGAGLNLALAADLRIASNSARYEARFLDLGVHPGGGNTWMLHQLVGPQTARAMILFGEVVDGPSSVDAGLSWRCVPDDQLLTTAIDLARKAATTPRELLQRTKATMADTATIVDHDAAIQRELGDQVWSVDQPAFQERLAKLSRKITSNNP